MPGIAVRVAERGGDVVGRAVSGDDGTFTLGDLPAGGAYVQVRSGRFAERWVEVDLTAGVTREVTVDLTVGRVARGTVRDAATRVPLAGVEVGQGWTLDRSVRTDAGGRYVLVGVEGTGAEIHVRAEGYAAGWQMLPSDVAEPVADFELRRGATVRGRLVDGRGLPVGDAYVATAADFHYVNALHTDWRRGVVGVDGRFAVEGVQGAAQLMVRGKDRGVRVFDLPRRLTEAGTLDLGDIVLRPPSSLEGRVRDASGAPVTGAQVTLAGTNGDCASAFAHLDQPLPPGWHPNPREIHHFKPVARRTALDGSFRFGGLAAGSYEVRVEAKGCPPAQAGPFVLADGDVREDADVVLARGRIIAGRVELPADLPAAAVPELVLTVCDAATRAHESTRVAASGAFRIGGLAGEHYMLSALECPAGYALSPLRDVTAGRDDLVLHLVPAARITGRVVDAAGRGVRANVFARLEPPVAFMSKNHATDADGRFALDVAPDFVGRVHASHVDNSFVQADVDGVAAGTSDLVLKLGAPARR